MELVWNLIWKWALVEAIAPLLGASIVFLAVGAASYAASNDKPNFKWAWKEAFDPLGWMYGAAFVAVQSGIKGLAVYNGYAAVVWFSFVCASVCVLMVVSAMSERGKNATWKPPAMLNGVALGLVAAIFLAGALLQFEISKGADNGRAQPAEAHPPSTQGASTKGATRGG